ncbi:MAG: hypothetical protein IKE28_02290 [Solobacterium sp.]|nr:hypothetical protein [Solobacterium sp.]
MSDNVITLTELNDQYNLPSNISIDSDKFGGYLENIKHLQRLPFSKADICYGDDLWDFSGYSQLNIAKSELRFNFSNVPEAFRDDLKNYVLAKILENKLKIQSIHSAMLSISQFFQYAESRHVYAVEDITKGIVKDYLQLCRNTKSLSGVRIAKTNIKSFYIQYDINIKDITTPGLMDLFEYDDHRAFKALKEQNRTKNIPDGYFNRLKTAIYTVINDDNVPVHIRAAACIYVILMQTGLRIGEILGLYSDSLKTTTIFTGEEAYYIEYRTWKREHMNNLATIAKTAANKEAKDAFDRLVELHKDKREALNLPYLYMGSDRYPTEDKFPLCSEDFKEDAFDLMIYLHENGLLETVDLSADTYPDIHVFKVRHRYIKGANGTKTPIITLSFPDTQQFRFHCCSELYNKGVPLEYIKRFMSHLTTEMVRYHIYPEKSPQENMEFSVSVLKGIITGETPILGGDKGLTKSILKFIESNNLSVEKDLETISKNLALKIPIRQKAGGVCIKSSQLRDCRVDGQTNEFYCAYGVCPNIVHFYYMADITYRHCKELAEVIGVNRIREQQYYNSQGKNMSKADRNIYPKQIQKNINMLYSLATKKLDPEITDLKRALREQGLEKVFYAHPELKDIVENLDTIEEELKVWKTLR